jgi:hypothetical protein
MLEIWLIPQLLEEKKDVVFQHDIAQPHIHNKVATFFNTQLPDHWIGREEAHFQAAAFSRSNPSPFLLGIY